MAIWGAVAKMGAGMLKGRKKKQSGTEVAAKVTGKEPTPAKIGSSSNVKPQQSLAPSSPTQNISKSTGSGTTSLKESALRIKTTTIEVNTLLRGSLVLDKMRAKNKKETREELKRTKAEDQLENDNKGKFSLPIPGAKKVKSLWERIKNFFITVFVGMIGIKLLPLVPHLMKALPLLAKAAEFIMDVGIWLVDALATAIKWGYDAYDWTRNQVKEKLGEGAAKKFDSFAGTLNKMMNLVLTLGMAAAAAAGQRDRGKPPRKPPRRKPQWQKKLQEKWKKSKPGKLVRNTKARILKTRRAITQAVKNPRQALKNLQKTQAGKKVTEIAKKIDPRKWKMPQVKTPGWMKRVGGAIKKRALGAIEWTKSLPAKTRQMYDEVAKRMGPYIDEMGQGIGKIGKRIGSKWTKITENMKPQKVIDELMAKIKPAIDDILKKNPIIGKIANKLKPKNAKGAIRGLLKRAAANPALKKVITTLKANKGASKGLGPVDKIITALMALMDYMGGGESPINAILKGLGGLLGYGVGFSAATAVPVLGQSGVFNFMGGMAGGIAGEWLAMKTAKVLAGTPLADIDDPIMGPDDIKAGRPARKLVRSTASLGDHMLKKPEVKALSDSKDVSTSTEYEDRSGGEGTVAFIPVGSTSNSSKINNQGGGSGISDGSKDNAGDPTLVLYQGK